jgi:hypothetical protein
MKWSSAQYCCGASLVWAAVAVVLHIPVALAWDSPQPLVRRASEAMTAVEKGDFAERVQRVLSRHLADATTTTTTTTVEACPVCNGSVEATTVETGPLRTVIAKIKGSLSETLTSDSTTTTAWDTTVASTEPVVAALESASAHFTALAAQAQALKTSTLAASATTTTTIPSSPLIVATFDLLEDITTTAADYLYQVTGLMARAEVTSVGMVTGMILSTLGLMERVSLGLVNVLTNALTALTAPPPSVQSEAVDSADIEVLLSLLAAGAASGGVFSDVLAFLEAHSDDSGLAAILTNAATDMQGIADRLSVFINLANAALASAVGQTNSTAVTTVQADTINEIIALITGIISTILSLVVDIITSVISLIAGIISAVLKLVLGIISAIINLIVSILNAILGIFSFQVQADAIGAASVGALVAMKIVGLMLDNPSVPVGVAKCALELTSCPYPVLEDLDCRTKALVCQNDALAQIIPS